MCYNNPEKKKGACILRTELEIAVEDGNLDKGMTLWLNGDGAGVDLVNLVQLAAKAKNSNWRVWSYNWWLLSNTGLLSTELSKYVIGFAVLRNYTGPYIEIMTKLSGEGGSKAFAFEDGHGFLSFSNALSSGNRTVIEYVMSQLIVTNPQINQVIVDDKLITTPPPAFEMLKGLPYHIIEMYALNSKRYNECKYLLPGLFKNLLVYECIKCDLQKDLAEKAIEAYLKLGAYIDYISYEYCGSEEKIESVRRLIKGYLDKILGEGSGEDVRKLIQYRDGIVDNIKALLANHMMTDEVKLSLLGDGNCKISWGQATDIMDFAILGNDIKFMQLAFGSCKSDKEKGQLFEYVCFKRDPSFQTINTLWYEVISEGDRKIFSDSRFWERQGQALYLSPLLISVCVSYISERYVPGTQYYAKDLRFKLVQDFFEEFIDAALGSEDEKEIKRLMEQKAIKNFKIENIKVLLANQRVTDDFKLGLLNRENCMVYRPGLGEIMDIAVLSNNKKFMQIAVKLCKSDKDKGWVFRRGCSLHGASFKAIKTFLNEAISEDDKLAFLGAQPWEQRLILNSPIIDILAFINYKIRHDFLGLAAVGVLVVVSTPIMIGVTLSDKMSFVSRTAILSVMMPVTFFAVAISISNARIEPEMLRAKPVNNAPASLEL